jgi:hypothetical protein
MRELFARAYGVMCLKLTHANSHAQAVILTHTRKMCQAHGCALAAIFLSSICFWDFVCESVEFTFVRSLTLVIHC